MSQDRDGGAPSPRVTPPAPSPVKQPYRAPQLIDYGTVSELTQGGTGTRTDGHPVKRFIEP